MFKKLTFLALALTISNFVFSQNTPIGTWKTIDDKTGQAKSFLKLYEYNGEIHGQITQLLQKPQDTKCEKCPGDKKNKLLVGMTVVWGLKPIKAYWGGGKILDPESGKDYGCDVWFENGDFNILIVKGIHWTGLSRKQKWYRVN